MKKILLTIWVGFAASSVFAQQGGFTGPSVSDSNQTVAVTDANGLITTVAKAKQLDDDSKVTLRGYIVQHLGKDKYLFKDATGQVIIEIDDDNWHGVIVGVNDLVELKGEIDRDENSFEIDVHTVQKVTKQ